MGPNEPESVNPTDKESEINFCKSSFYLKKKKNFANKNFTNRYH